MTLFCKYTNFRWCFQKMNNVSSHLIINSIPVLTKTSPSHPPQPPPNLSDYLLGQVNKQLIVFKGSQQTVQQRQKEKDSARVAIFRRSIPHGARKEVDMQVWRSSVARAACARAACRTRSPPGGATCHGRDSFSSPKKLEWSNSSRCFLFRHLSADLSSRRCKTQAKMRESGNSSRVLILLRWLKRRKAVHEWWREWVVGWKRAAGEEVVEKLLWNRFVGYTSLFLTLYYFFIIFYSFLHV